MMDLTPLLALVNRWRKQAKADRMAAALLGAQRETRHQATAVEDLAARSEQHAKELEAALADGSEEPPHE